MSSMSEEMWLVCDMSHDTWWSGNWSYNRCDWYVTGPITWWSGNWSHKMWQMHDWGHTTYWSGNCVWLVRHRCLKRCDWCVTCHMMWLRYNSYLTAGHKRCDSHIVSHDKCDLFSVHKVVHPHHDQWNKLSLTRLWHNWPSIFPGWSAATVISITLSNLNFPFNVVHNRVYLWESQCNS